MHIHVLGICGTFMGGLALLARELGHRVTGTDAAAYPPMSELLASAGIEVERGYDGEPPASPPDCTVIGNALSRGNPMVERLLNDDLAYTSGPQWLAEQVLRKREVITVAGTHGKTTTASMCAWILDRAGHRPGYLIGGAPAWTDQSARLGAGGPFVVEGDEYDTAFFDKRAKLVHYRPRILLLNNLEYDHADIYPDLDAIATQIHHAVRTVPAAGRIIVNGDDANLEAVLRRGCWTPVERVGAAPENDWRYAVEGGAPVLYRHGRRLGTLRPPLPGRHNLANAAGAVAAAAAVGADPEQALEAIGSFPGVRRRLEHRGEVAGITVLDDFAHHPTAVAVTLEALRDTPGRLLAVLEPRSNTMRLGVHRDRLAGSLRQADLIFALETAGDGWSVAEALRPLGGRATVFRQTGEIVDAVCAAARAGDRIVVMSNGSFDGIHERLLARLAEVAA